MQDEILKFVDHLKLQFNNRLALSKDFEMPKEDWRGTMWVHPFLRKCNLQVIDSRKDNKILMVHLNIFPALWNQAPIFGLDIVAGSNKITGAFLDYSRVDEEDTFYSWFLQNTYEKSSWKKTRELPAWAKTIFSEHMIAVSNITDPKECEQFLKTAQKLLSFYLNNTMTEEREGDVNAIKEAQNYYCSQQKKNEHLHKSILKMGLTESEKDDYINRILFHEIQ